MMKTKNIMIVGVGGQGTLLTSRILGGVILESGYDVKLSEVHGMAQRGGSVVTYVRYGEKVYEPIGEEGQVDIIMAFEKLEALRYAHYLKPDGTIIVNNQEINPMSVITGSEDYPRAEINKLLEKENVILVDALEEARKIENLKVVNVVILGVLSNYMEISTETWEKVIGEKVPEFTIEDNLKAFNVGRNIKN